MKKMMRSNYVRPTSKGQVTLPVSVRRALNIDPDTLLGVTVEDGRVVLAPVQIEDKQWETVIDFTQFSPDGIALTDLQRRLRSWTKSTKPSKS